jgi:hypothetical protein
MRKLAFHPAGNRKNLEKKKEQEKEPACVLKMTSVRCALEWADK